MRNRRNLFSGHRHPSPANQQRRRFQPNLEALETRNLLSVFTPAQIRQAYGFDQSSLTGAGQTIAIVDAYDAPNIAADLLKFDKAYLNPNETSVSSFFTKVNQSGSSAPLPAANSGWAQEISLDVEWAHAVAPGAHILLVEANSASFGDLLAAVDYARGAPGVVAVSMSWGGSEFQGEAAYDSHFTTPNGHVGGSNGQGGLNLPGYVTFVASSGDTGAQTEYPAVSPNVLGVGGTSLFVNTSGNWSNETGWNGSGGGVSAYESRPGYQDGVTTGNRNTPDVAYNADPNTGVLVYYQNNLWIFGGTSAGAPQWAGLVAVADEGRALNGQGSLDGRSQTLPTLYTAGSGTFHDVINGTASSRVRNKLYTQSARAGYDLVTGLGTPLAPSAISTLLHSTIPFAAAPTGSGGGGGSGTGGRHALTVTVGGLTPTLLASDALPGLTAIPTLAPSVVIFAPQSPPALTTSLVIAAPPVRPPQSPVTSRLAIGETVLPAEPPVARIAGDQENGASQQVTPARPAVPAGQEDVILFLGPARVEPARLGRFMDELPWTLESAPIQEETSGAVRPLAALAGVAFALNGFWLDPATERRDVNKRRNAVPLPR